MSAPAIEINRQTSEALPELISGREYLAAVYTAGELRDTFNADRYVGPNRFNLANTEYGGLISYEGEIGAGALLALEAIEVDTALVLAKAGGYPENPTVITSKELPDGNLTIKQHYGGVSYTLTELENQQPETAHSAFIRERITARLLKSPAHKAVVDAGKKLAALPEIPDTFATESFSLTEDLLGTIDFLRTSGCTFEDNIAKQIQKGVDPKQFIYAQLKEKSLATVFQQGNKTVYMWGDTTLRELVVNMADDTAVFRVTQCPIAAYLEKASRHDASSLPFIESKCAQDLSATLDQMGLMFHPRLQLDMMKPGQIDIHGSIYTQITREVAKWIDNPEKVRLRNVIVPKDLQFLGKSLAERVPTDLQDTWYEDILRRTGMGLDDLEAKVRTMYSPSAANHVLGEAAKTVFAMIDGVLARRMSADGAVLSNLPVTNETITFTKGGCFDVLSYYISAAGDVSQNPHYLRQIDVGNVRMLKKGTGLPTYLTTAPIVFNGVPLPKGSLFAKAIDDKWALLRLTPFAYDDPVDQLAFGSEISKALSTERISAKALGEVSITALQKSMH